MLVKLTRVAKLSPAEIDDVLAWPHDTEIVPNGRYLVREGDQIDRCCVLLDGYAYRSKMTGDGARQIVSFHVVGDIIDLQHLFLDVADHNVQAMNEAVVAWIPINAIKTSMTARPAVAAALWRDSLIDSSIFREWVLNVGRREARARIAHLLCEFIYRRAVVVAGQQKPPRFDLPMSQEQIADATGMTPVHVNRKLQHLEAEGLIQRDRRAFSVENWSALCAVADFDPSYLHLG